MLEQNTANEVGCKYQRSQIVLEERKTKIELPAGSLSAESLLIIKCLPFFTDVVAFTLCPHIEERALGGIF